MMKVEQGTVRKVELTEIDRLDAITVYLEDYEAGKGKITISCYGEAWSCYWGHMGNCMIDEHFISSKEDSLVNYLSKLEPELIAEEEDLQEDAKRKVIKMRRQKEIEGNEARELFEEIDGVDFYQENYELMRKIYGEEWWNELPTVPNHQYQYLCEIIRAVQAGLKELIKAEAA